MQVTLTFDNGPDPAGTRIILDALDKHDVKAVFFLLGSHMSSPGNMTLARETFSRGHHIGNHTFTHEQPLGVMADQDSALREITDTAALIEPLTGARKMFRPVGQFGAIGPHMFSARTWQYLSEEQYDAIVWNCLAREWDHGDAWLEPTLADVETRDWSVVVLHDIFPNAMQHVDRFIAELKARGAVFSQDFPDDCVAMRRGVATALGESIGCAPAASF
jgi:peptidoglycan-N-acetylglucosamine deacetylase